MKRVTKILICFLALCLLLPCMAACNQKKKKPSSTPSKKPTSNAVTTVDPDADIEKPEIIDMDGYIYKAYVRDFSGDTLDEQLASGNNLYRCIDFWIDESNSEQDVISFAVYTRNNRIEADYNCKIRQTGSNGNQIDQLRLFYTNGDTYDLAILSAKPAAQAATQNLLHNLNETTYTNLSHPAFDQNSIHELSIENNLYFISGDMNVSTLEVAGLSLVNMDFYEDMSDSIVDDLFDGNPLYSNIYNLVTAKKWTMDTLLKIATHANIDVDKNDGDDLSVIDKGDTMGYHQYFYSTLWYFYASGGRITTKGDNGIPELTIQTEKNQNIANYLYDHFNGVVSNPWIPRAMSSILDQNFLTGELLFMDCSLFEIRTEIYPFAEFEYGILPCPVYEEGQDYHSVIYFNNWAHLWTLPNMLENTEYAERLLEIMAVYSSFSGSTMDAYYERTIYLNAARDNGSRQVLDVVRQSLVYDIALMYDWGGLEKMLESISYENSNPYASAVNGIEASVNPKIEDTVEQLRNPSGV